MGSYDILSKCTGFEWHKHNSEKNWRKHRVTSSECEEIFFNQPLVVADDIKHSEKENRFYALDHTNGERKLFVVFTIARNLIRVVSARDMNQKERMVYKSYEEEKEDT